MSENESQHLLDYKDLLDEVEELGQLPSNSQKLEKASIILQKATSLLEENSLQNNAVDAVSIDMEVFKNAVNIICGEIATLDEGTKQYNPVEFAEKLLNIVGGRNQDWLKIFDMSMLGASVLPQNASIYGSFIPDPPVPKVRKPRAKAEVFGQLQKPENIIQTEQMEEGSEILIKIKKIISQGFTENNNEPLNYCKLVIDPNDFGTTIDNIFQISFLVRDRFVEIEYNNEDLVIKPLTKAECLEQKSSEPFQEIISLQKDQWRKLIEIYDIKKPMINIPDRHLLKKSLKRTVDNK